MLTFILLNENKKTKKICFLPIKHNSTDLNDIDFYERALECGKVFTLEEYVEYFNSRNIMDIQPSLGEMRVVESLEYIMGICPDCGNAIALDDRHKGYLFYRLDFYVPQKKFSSLFW